jgi:hypothetical protein
MNMKMKMKMKMKTKKSPPAIVGRIAQVDVCPCDAGFVLSVGPVSIWLPLDAARDVVATLARALLLDTRGLRDSHELDRPADAELAKPTPASTVAQPPARGTSN